MRRILTIMILAAILLGACSPTVTLFTREPAASATPDSSTELPPAPTLVPTPTRSPDLGISPDALRGVEIVVWHGWDGRSAGLFARMAAEFTLSNEWGIKIKVVPWPNLNLLAAEVDKALRSSEKPDLLVAMPEQILAWHENILDLSPYIAQPEFGLDAGEATGAFWDQSNVNGVRYGIPAARSARLLYYNVSFARDLGFEAGPLTADEFRAQACAANAFWKQDQDLTNDGFGGLALDVTSNWQTPYSWLAAGGGELFVDGTFRFNSPQNDTALEFVSRLRDDGCAWQAATSSNYEHLAARRALFISASLGELADQSYAFSAALSGDEWTVLPFPGKQPSIVGYGPDYAVLKSIGARQLAAWLFIRWMLDTQNQARWSRGTGFLPATSPAVAALQADASSLPPQWLAALRLIPQSVPYPQTVRWQLADKILADGFLAYFENYPNSSLTDILKMMDATYTDLTK